MNLFSTIILSGQLAVTGNVTIKTNAPVNYPWVATLQMDAPLAQVFQRQTPTNGSIPVSGRAVGGQDVQGRLSNSNNWVTVASSVNGQFYGSITNQYPGQGQIQLRLSVSNNVTANSVSTNIGLGDVFLIGGQSNACGQGTNKQVFVKAGNYDAWLFNNLYHWTNLVDYTDTSTNSNQWQTDHTSDDLLINGSQNLGSMWPYLGTFLATNQNCPVAFIPCALGATVIEQWLPAGSHFTRTNLYGSMALRGSTNYQPNGIKAMLWWQGEGNVLSNSTAYVTNFTLMTSNLFADIGCKTVPFLMPTNSSVNYATPAQIQVINTAMLTVWTNQPTKVGTPADGTLVDLQDTVNHIHAVTPIALSNCAVKFFQAITNTFP